MSAPSLSDDDLQKIYAWVDQIPLSRPKRNISRDFSDAVLMAEVVAHYFPRMVDLHNYSAANSIKEKFYNWETLNKKVFTRLGYQMQRHEIEGAATGKPGYIEYILMQLQAKMAEYRKRKEKRKSERASTCPAASLARITKYADRTPYSASDSVDSAPEQFSAPPSRGGAPLVTEATHGPRSQLEYPPAVSAPAGSSVQQLLAEKDKTISEMQETIEVLELKIRKLEQLVRLKDSRIQTLTARIKSQHVST